MYANICAAHRGRGLCEAAWRVLLLLIIQQQLRLRSAALGVLSLGRLTGIWAALSNQQNSTLLKYTEGPDKGGSVAASAEIPAFVTKTIRPRVTSVGLPYFTMFCLPLYIKCFKSGDSKGAFSYRRMSHGITPSDSIAGNVSGAISQTTLCGKLLSAVLQFESTRLLPL